MAIDDFIPAKRGSLDWHMRLLTDFLNWGLPLLKTGDYEVKDEIARTGLVPLWFTPYLLCPPHSSPPLATPGLTWENKKLVTCLSKWQTTIIDAIGVGTLEPCRPDTWPNTPSDSAITAEWLLPWEDLRRWANEDHGVEIGDLPVPNEAAVTLVEAPDTHEEQKSSVLADDLPEKRKGVTVELPHMNRALEAIFKIMWDHWGDVDQRHMPKQVNIATEIDAAIGYNPQSDGPSRNAKVIAAILKPDADPNYPDD